MDVNLYADVGNNSINLSDPFGLLVGGALSRIAPYISSATSEEAALVGRVIDSAIGGAIAAGGPKIPQSIQNALGVSLPVLEGGSGIRTIGLSVMVGGAAASAGAAYLAGGLAIAGGMEVGSAFNDLYRRASGQDLGADIYDFFHPSVSFPK